MAIVIVRHATPKINYQRCNYKEAISRLTDYNLSKLVEEDEISVDLIKENIDFKRDLDVLCSPKNRATLTHNIISNELKIDKKVSIKDELDEIPLRIINIPLIRIKPTSWFLISRLKWIFSNYIKDKNKINKKCKSIIDSIKENNNAIIISHGFLRLFLRKALKKDGYIRFKSYKSGCFCVEVWEYEK
jgi:hypothetical protein